MALGNLIRSDVTSKRLAILVALAFFATAATALAHPTPTLAWSEGAYSSSAERELVALTNRSRAAAGRKALKVSSTLTSIARWRSKDMIKRDYFSHSIPGYGNVFKKMSASGFCYHLAGENIGWITGSDSSATESIHEMFMNSSGHRANILGKDWDVIGVGTYKGADGKKMYTVLFADKCGSTKSTTKPKPKSTTKPKPKPKTERPKATSRPKPKATPKPTPTPAPTPVLEPVIGPADLTPSDAPPEPTPSSTGDGGSADGPSGATPGQGLRIADPAAPSLVDSIVGDVTGLFLGG